MSEEKTISSQALPLTVDSLTADFRACGLAAGQIVLVHTEMSQMGWICGGAETLIRALLNVLTPDGTLMMPAHSAGNSDPSHWRNPPVPEHWWPIIRENMPAFDRATTRTRRMGAAAELLRTWPGSLRSNHPIGSCCALGKHAKYLTETHPLDDEFGPLSPLGKLYELDGLVMLIGVNHDRNTSLHMAEFRANWPGKRIVREGAAIFVNGERRWVTYESPDLDTDDFNTIGAAFEAAHGLSIKKVGGADVRFFKQRPLIDFAVKWMELNRK